jgi:hypothetical protein
MNWKGFGRKRLRPNRVAVPEFAVGTETEQEKPQDNRFPGLDSNLISSEYKCRALPLCQSAR